MGGISAGPLENQPLSRRVRDDLLRAIRAGAFPDGRLPPEAELSSQLGVSRTTVRAALQSLAEDGIVSRRRRHGTVVNDELLRASMPLNRLVSFHDLIEQCGHVPSVDPQTHATGPASDEAAAALAIEPGSDVLLVRRLLRAGGAPVITIEDTIPLVHVPAAGQVVAADSTFAFLVANGCPPAEIATCEIVPRVAGGERPRGLDLPAGTPYIELRETLLSRDHERLAFSRIQVDDRLVRFSLLRRDF